jgi:SSS family solute:Na+ symporter
MTKVSSMLAIAAIESRLTGVDWMVIGPYFSIPLCVVWWVVRKGKDSAADYFLAGRNLAWWVIGASIFASNIGSEHVVGFAGSGATSGALRTARLERSQRA